MYVSSYTPDAIVHHGARSANFVFLSKPFSLSTLCRKVRQALDSEPAAESWARVATDEPVTI